MKARTSKLYYVGIGQHSLSVGKPVLILGVVMLYPEGCISCPCFKVRYFNDHLRRWIVAYIPIFADGGTRKNPEYALLSQCQARRGQILPVANDKPTSLLKRRRPVKK